MLHEKYFGHTKIEHVDDFKLFAYPVFQKVGGFLLYVGLCTWDTQSRCSKFISVLPVFNKNITAIGKKQHILSDVNLNK